MVYDGCCDRKGDHPHKNLGMDFGRDEEKFCRGLRCVNIMIDYTTNHKIYFIPNS